MNIVIYIWLCVCVCGYYCWWLYATRTKNSNCLPSNFSSISRHLVTYAIGTNECVYTNQLYYCYIKYFQLKEKTKCLNMAPILSTSFLLLIWYHQWIVIHVHVQDFLVWYANVIYVNNAIWQFLRTIRKICQ